MLRVEAEALADTSEAGERMREFLNVVRHCIFVWIVSTTARPRDRFGYIAAERPAKRALCAAVFTRHLDPLLETTEYRDLKAMVVKLEEEEIGLGALANRGAEGRCLSLQISASSSHLSAQIHRAAAAVAVGSASSQSKCELCLTTDNCHIPLSSFPHSIPGGCVCMTAYPSQLSFCRQVHASANKYSHPLCPPPPSPPPPSPLPPAKLILVTTFIQVMDALRAGNHDDCVRLLLESPGDVQKHAGCRDQSQISWLHMAADKAWIDVADTILQASNETLELVDTVHGKPIAYALERGNMEMLDLLISYGADTQSPCTPAAKAGSGRTPSELADRWYEREPERLRLLKQRLSPGEQRVALPPARAALAPSPSKHATSAPALPQPACCAAATGPRPVLERPASPALAPTTLVPHLGAFAQPDLAPTQPAAPADSAALALQPVPSAAAAMQIGSSEWKLLPEDDKHRQVRSLFDTVALTSLQRSGVGGMLSQYLRKIAPLERLPKVRGDGWRETKHAGQQQMQAWSDLLKKSYEPILCRVLEYSDAAGVDIWSAADAIEEVRLSGGTTWESLRKTEQVKRLSQADSRAPLLKRLQSAEFGEAALALLASASSASAGSSSACSSTADGCNNGTECGGQFDEPDRVRIFLASAPALTQESYTQHGPRSRRHLTSTSR